MYSIHSFLTRINSFFNIIQFSWKGWCGIWISLVTLTPPGQVPLSLCIQSGNTEVTEGSPPRTSEAPKCFNTQCYKLTHSATNTAESCQVPCGYSHSFSFFHFGDQISVQYFHFLTLTWQNLWTAWDRGGEQPPLGATSQVLSQIREKDHKKQTLWRQDGVFFMAIVLPYTTGSTPTPPSWGRSHTHLRVFIPSDGQ